MADQERTNDKGETKNKRIKIPVRKRSLTTENPVEEETSTFTANQTLHDDGNIIPKKQGEGLEALGNFYNAITHRGVALILGGLISLLLLLGAYTFSLVFLFAKDVPDLIKKSYEQNSGINGKLGELIQGMEGSYRNFSNRVDQLTTRIDKLTLEVEDGKNSQSDKTKQSKKPLK